MNYDNVSNTFVILSLFFSEIKDISRVILLIVLHETSIFLIAFYVQATAKCCVPGWMA